MATAKRILEIARAEIGVKESPANSNRTKYGAAYGWNGVAWCVIFVWWCFKEAGADALLPVKTASCWQLMNAAKKAGIWVTNDFKPGDILIYDFPGGAATDHTGICESVTAKSVTAIEGNTGLLSNSNGGKVMRRTRKLSLVRGAVRPKYDKKPLILIAQEVLEGAYGDGDMRRNRLTARGYDPAEIQRLVNALVTGKYRARVTADALKIRAGAGTNYKKTGVLMRGATVTVREAWEGTGAEAWGHIPDGWIALDYTEEV